MATNHLTLQGICSFLLSLPISMKCLVHFYFLSFFFFFCELPFDLHFFHRWPTLLLSKKKALFNIKVNVSHTLLFQSGYSVFYSFLSSLSNPQSYLFTSFSSPSCVGHSPLSLRPVRRQRCQCFFLRSLTLLLSGPGEPWEPSSVFLSSSTNLLSSSSFSSASASASLKSVSDSSEFSSSRYR